MDFYKKIKLTLLFTFGLFLFWFNQVYAVELDCTSTFQMGGSYSRYLYMDDVVMDYISTVPEYSGIGSTYNMFGTLNTSNSSFEFYFTPYENGTPSQLNLNTNKLLFTGTYNYIKYSISSVNFNQNTWSRSTGTHTGNTSWTIYTRLDGNNFYYYYWGSTYATWFNNTNWNGFPVIPVYNAFVPPDLNNWTTNDSTTPMTFTSVEDTAYIVVHRNSIPLSSTMILNCYDVTNGTNLVQEFELNQNSPFLSSDNTQYTIGLYVSNWFHTVNGNKYLFTLTYLDNSNNTHTLSYWFNLVYDSATVENIQDNTQQDIKNTFEETQSFLTDSNVDYDTIVGNFEESRVNFNFTGTNYLTTFFQFLTNIFVTDNYQDFVFTIPNSNGQTITIPADYMETHIPTGIIGLIRIFYWYMISRYIIKDIFGIIDRLRAGKVTDIDNNDIKADML